MDEKYIKQSKLIYWASGIVSICGIIFEVLFGALGSYILGDGVKQYTLTISLFLTGMGIGASISGHILKKLLLTFIWVEFGVGLIGGFSSFTMFGITAFAPGGTDAFYLYFITFVIGALTGIELPILIRKANEIGVSLNKSTARVLFSDYAGGLIGGLLFVFLLRPQFGMVKSAFIVGFVNVLVALIVLWMFRKDIHHFKLHACMGICIGVLLIFGMLFGKEMAFSFEQKLYKDPIVYMQDSKYQKLVLTKNQGDTRFYLNGNLQFSSTDEYRYHEVLIHPTMSIATSHKNILVLGGGDGIAAKELLKYNDVGNITLVDLDPAVIKLANTNRQLLQLNKGSLMNDKVQVVNADAFQFLKKNKTFYDVIIIDLPDPNNESLNKLYTEEFYSVIRNHLSPNGVTMIQATSPVFATQVYWTISKTVASTGLHVKNLHVDVPSFGNWGFVMASRKQIDLDHIHMTVPTRFIKDNMIPRLTTFGKDIDDVMYDKNGKKIDIKPNTLIDPDLIRIYNKAWKNY